MQKIEHLSLTSECSDTTGFSVVLDGSFSLAAASASVGFDFLGLPWRGHQ